MSRTISIVGAGRVGRTLGRSLRRLGWRIGAVVTRSAAASRAAVRAIGAGKPRATITREAVDADVILLACRTTCSRGGQSRANWPSIGEQKMPRQNGAAHEWRARSTVLQPLARRGAATGSIHPMQTFQRLARPNLKGVIFAIEGEPAARAARPENCARARRHPRRHARAQQARVSRRRHARRGPRAGLDRSCCAIAHEDWLHAPSRIQTLLPLIRQMLDNYERHGPRAAWTGPASRGDYATIAKHGSAMRSHPREFRRSVRRALRCSPRACFPRIPRQRKIRAALETCKGASLS